MFLSEDDKSEFEELRKSEFTEELYYDNQRSNSTETHGSQIYEKAYAKRYG